MIKITEHIVLELAILCEDVREEIGGKSSAMGIFTGDILVGEMPANIRVAFLFTLNSPVVGQHRVGIRISGIEGSEKETIFEGASSIAFQGPNVPATIVIPTGFMRFEKPRTFIVELEIGGSWVQVLRKKVMLQQTAR
jgi:hypothetical protein